MAAFFGDNMDPSVYYYTYSTLAQSLAGAFGFLAAVVLYRLQSLNGQLQVIATNLIGDPRTFVLEPFRTLFAYHRWAQFVRQVHLDQESRAPVFKDLNFMDLGAMNHASQQIQMIRRWFIISMIMTVAGIASSLVALFLMAWMQSLVVLAVLLILGLFSLAAYTRLMLLVLE
jgi:hypothetical protein